jgi:SH3-like domain-containing protein
VKNYIENNPEAIVLVGSVSVKSSPDDSGTEVFVIHEGTKVNVLSTLANWSEVRLADGNVGWLLSSAIEKI